ncbi:MAG: aminotransferase class V-fold PLP-dependent enzyme [Planctomycetota bacterium]
MRPIYLDYNTTTPIAPRVQEAMLPFLAEHFHDPGGFGPESTAVGQAMSDARSRVRAAVGAVDEHRVVFTGGGASSCLTAIRGVVDNWHHCEYAPTCHIVVSGIEHSRVAEPVRHLETLGRIETTQVPCDASGVVEWRSIADAIRDDTALVWVAHADHLTGVIQPVKSIAEECHRRRTLLHVDASVSFGKVPIDVEEMGVDLLSISGRTVYGPSGIGALYARDTAVLEPSLHEGPFGENEFHNEAPNVPGAVALGRAAELATAALNDSAPRLASLRDQLEAKLGEALGDAVQVVAGRSNRLPNTSLMKFGDWISLNLLGDETDLRVALLHDASMPIFGRTHLFGDFAEPVLNAVPISVGWYTTEEEIDRAASLLIDAWERATGR